jgi:hypothetical protein
MSGSATARNPYAFAPAIAPHLAAPAGVKIELGRIILAYRGFGPPIASSLRAGGGFSTGR